MSDLPAVKRPWWKSWRFLLLIFGTPIGVVGLTYGILCWRFYMNDPVISRDYVAEANAQILKIPPEQRAWTHYRRALMALRRMPDDFYSKDVSEMIREGIWRGAAADLRESQAALEMVRQATKIRPLGRVLAAKTDPEDIPAFERHGFTVNSKEDERDPTAAWINSPYLHAVYKLAYLLLADAHRAAMDKQPELMVANLVAVLDMSRQVDAQATLVEELIAASCVTRGTEKLHQLLENHSAAWTPTALAEMARALDTLLADGPIRISTAGERLFFADFIQRVFTDDGKGNGFLRIDIYEEATSMWGLDERPFFDDIALKNRFGPPVLSLYTADREETVREYNAFMDALDQRAALPLWQRTPGVVEAMIHDWDASPVYYRVFSSSSMMDVYPKLGEDNTQTVDAARVIVGIHRYQREHQKWPDILAELVPKYLPSVPPDRFDGQPLRYALRDGQPVVYSIGTNLKDDGGARAKDDGEVMQWPSNPSIDGDWVFWPPKKRDAPVDDGTPTEEGEAVSP